MRICCSVAGEGGVAFYRMLQPYKWIAENTDTDVFIYNPKLHTPQRLQDEMEAADVWVYQMTFGEFIQKIIIENKKRLKPKKIVLEYDDYIFGVHPMNDAYKTFGQEEVMFNTKDKKTAELIEQMAKTRGLKRKYGWGIVAPDIYSYEMWKDGQDGFDVKANKLRADGCKFALANADLVTVTCPELGNQFRDFRPKGTIAVMPNLIDFDRWLPIKPNETNEIRIGWHGGSAHFQDLHMIRKALWRILDKYPNVKIVMKGVGFYSLFKPCTDNNMKDYSNRVEWVGWHSDINTYPLDMRDMKVDIGLCPVIDDAFNRGKSELKWLEYSALKVPTVLSPVCYISAKHGKTAFFATTEDEWFKYIEQYILDANLRKEIAEKAYTRVKTYHGVDQSIMWNNCLKDLVNGTTKKTILRQKELIHA